MATSNSTNPNVSIRLSAEGIREVVAALAQVQAAAQRTSNSAASVNRNMTAASSGVGLLGVGVKKLVAAAAGLAIMDKVIGSIGAGIAKNMNFETARAGIAAVMFSQAKLVDSTGKVLAGQEAYTAAVKQSDYWMTTLQSRISGTALEASFDTLAAASSKVVFAGLNNGIKDMDALQNLTIAAANAMQAYGGDIASVGDMVADTLQGGGDLATKFLQISPETVKKWKEQGTLVSELTRRLSDFTIANEASANTTENVIKRAGNAITILSGKITSGFMEKIAEGLRKLLSLVYDKTGAVNKNFEPILAALSSVGGALGGVISSALTGVVSLADKFGGYLRDNRGDVDGLASSIGRAYDQMVKLAGKAADMAGGPIGKVLVGAATVITYAVDKAAAVGLDLAQQATRTGREINSGPNTKKWDNTKKAFEVEDAKTQRATDLENQKKYNEAARKLSDDATNKKLAAKGLPPMVRLPMPTSDLPDPGGNGSNKKATPKPDSTVAGPKNVDPAAGLAEAAKAAKERAGLLQQEADTELKLLKAKHALAEGMEKQSYADGLITLADYQADRLARLEAETTAEANINAAALKAAQELPANSKDEAYTRTLAIKKAQADIEVAAYEVQAKRGDMAREQLQEQKALTEELNAKKLEGMEIGQQVLEIYGETNAAVAAGIDIEIEKLDQLLKKRGMADTQRASVTSAARAKAQGAADYTDLRTKADSSLYSNDSAKAAEDRKASTGQVYNFEAKNKKLELDRAQLKVMQDMLPAMKAAAEASKEPGNIQAVMDFKASIDDLAASVDEYGQSMATLKNGAFDAFGQGFNGFLDNVISGTASVSDAFRGMAFEIVDSIRKIAQEILVNKALEALFGTSPQGGKGGSGISGVIGGLLSNMGGFAEGGYISGPGTGTSDSIPALLSNGEYVMPARTVQQYGIAQLDAMRAGHGAPAGMGKHDMRGSLRFADGGLVGSLQAAGGSTSVTVGLEPGLVLREMRSAAGQRVQVENYSKNRRAIGSLG